VFVGAAVVGATVEVARVVGATVLATAEVAAEVATDVATEVATAEVFTGEAWLVAADVATALDVVATELLPPELVPSPISVVMSPLSI